MQSYKMAVLAGDGIGPEVMQETLILLGILQQKFGFVVELLPALVGGAAIDVCGEPLPEATMQACRQSDAILFGSVGGPKWTNLPPDLQPERGALLPLRAKFGLYANLRPGICLAELTHASPVKQQQIEGGFDILCVRELTGGIYFGKPRAREMRGEDEVAYDTMIYSRKEIERIAHVAFRAAIKRGGKLVSVDKANVLASSVLWREIMTEISAQYPQVQLEHMYVDNAAMQLIKAPKNFDVLVTENLFGDILSDEMAMICGSLGMLPSASLGECNEDGLYFGMYEPSGGSAPDIAGKGIANPCAQILSLAMLLRYSFGQLQAADALDAAVAKAIAAGYRTADIATGAAGEIAVSTAGMGQAIASFLK